MKQKTSITLSKDLLDFVDRLAGTRNSRSGVIERVLRAYFREHKRAAIAARDLALINSSADQLNAEAEEVLQFQAMDTE